MPTDFDAYHKWLGIPPKDQPPNHYRLLALELFESDPEIIDTAANRQMSYLQQLATGQYTALSQKLLTEVSAARLCLLDRKRKAEYDRELRSALAARPAAQEPLAENRASELPASEKRAAKSRRKPAAAGGRAPGRAKSAVTAKRRLILGGAGILAVSLAVLAWAAIAGRKPSGAEGPLRLLPIAPQAVKAGEKLTVAVSVENADAWKGKVHYGFRGEALSDATIDPQSGTFAWSPKLDQLGRHAVVVSVETADGLLCDTTPLGINVTPLLEINIDKNSQTVEAGKPANVRVTVKYADFWQGKKVQYRLANCPRGAKFDAETGEFSWTPLADQAKDDAYQATVSARGPDGQEAKPMSFRVTVTAAPPPPKPFVDIPKPETKADVEPVKPPEPPPETGWVRTAKQAATNHNGALVQDLPLKDGAARIPGELLGRLASQELCLGAGKLDDGAGQTWDFGQGFEQTRGESTQKVPSLAEKTGHARVDVSLEKRLDGLYLALRGVSQSDVKTEEDFAQKEKDLSKAMAVIRGWYAAEPGLERKDVAKMLSQNGVNMPPMKAFEPIPPRPYTLPATPKTSPLKPSRNPSTQAYELAVAKRKSQVDHLLNNIEKRLEVFKKRAEDARKKPDSEREAADKVLVTACKSVSAVVYPSATEIEGNQLYQLGVWRLYWTSNRNCIDVWYREGSLAVEIIGSAASYWHWRDGFQEYLVMSSGNPSASRFSLRPWEQPGAAPAMTIPKPSRSRRPTRGASQEPPDPSSAMVIHKFPEFSMGGTRLRCDGEQISIAFGDGGTLSILLASPEVLFKTARNGNTLKFASGIRALPVGDQ
jgi:hypothetical protein